MTGEEMIGQQARLKIDDGKPQIDSTVVSSTGGRLEPDFPFLASGTVFAGKYEILALVGRGGMGTVYRARHIELDSIVAIKTLHRHLAHEKGVLERFRREARAANRLRHENLVSVTDFGESQSGDLFIVMDFMQGRTLAEKLARDGRLSFNEFLRIFSQVLAGLQACHSEGIAHRDIKPSNIILSAESLDPGTVKVVDFGIAKVLEENGSSEALTGTGELIGSPLYMSPEQCHGDSSIDGGTDLYSLACVMFESLGGRPPFQGGSAIETIMMHCSEPYPGLGQQSDPGLDSELHLWNSLDELIGKALSKSRQERFSDAAQMRARLHGAFRSSQLPGVAREMLAPAPRRPGARSMLSGLKRVVVPLMVVSALGLGIVIVQPVSGSGNENAKNALELGRYLRLEGDVGKSEKKLVEALGLVRSAFGEDSGEYLIALDELSLTEEELSFLDDEKHDQYLKQAQSHLRQALTLAGRLDKSEIKRVVTREFGLRLYFQYARLLSDSREDAERAYDRAIAFVGEDALVEDDSLEPFLREYSEFLWSAGREKEAAILELRHRLPRWKAVPAIKSGFSDKVDGRWAGPDFELSVVRRGGGFEGSHRAISPEGDRIDVADSGETSIRSAMAGGVLKGTIDSSFEGLVNFKVVRVGDYLVWKTMNPVGSLDGTEQSPLPDTAVLALRR